MPARDPSIADFMPGPPDWSLDWQALDDAYSWIRTMKGSTQDPRHHAEGDVWTHTAMTVEELVADEAWRSSPYAHRLVTFAAMVGHDVAKPATRDVVEGRIVNPHHSRVGASMMRLILREQGLPFHLREAVCAIIAIHQKPFWLIEEEKDWRATETLVRASLSVPNSLVAMVARADARGRICEGRQRIIDNVELYLESARILGCSEQPFPFDSAHARVRYFLAPDRRMPGDCPFDSSDENFTLTMLAGLPASGKSSWAGHETSRGALAGQEIVSLDTLRKEMRVGPGDDQGRVRQAALARVRQMLAARRSFVWDNMNLDMRRRAPILGLASDYGARVRIVYFETDEAERVRRNRGREDGVPEATVDKMARRLQPPTLAEAHGIDFIVPSCILPEVASPGMFP